MAPNGSIVTRTAWSLRERGIGGTAYRVRSRLRSELAQRRLHERSLSTVEFGQLGLVESLPNLRADDLVVLTHTKFGPQVARLAGSDRKTHRQVFLRRDYDFRLAFPPRTVVDLGANVGYSAVYFKHRFPEAQVIAVEPDAQNCALAKANLSLANAGDIVVEQSAVWHRTTYLQILNPSAAPSGFKVAEAEPGSSDSFPALTVGAIMERHGLSSIDLLKVDIEAAERFIFANSAEWLQHVDMIVIELHDRFTPGCSEAVVGALDRYFGSYTEKVQGENTLFTRNLRMR